MMQDRQREITYRDLERLDEEQALLHRSERQFSPARRRSVKDDRRSSDKLTERERNTDWPIG
jgi:hypothetical protein